jgi:hypothetical protein
VAFCHGKFDSAAVTAPSSHYSLRVSLAKIEEASNGIFLFRVFYFDPPNLNREAHAVWRRPSTDAIPVTANYVVGKESCGHQRSVFL